MGKKRNNNPPILRERMFWLDAIKLDLKICVICGNDFRRRIYAYFDSRLNRMAFNHERIEGFEKRKTCSRKCLAKFTIGKNNSNWKMGISKNDNYYRLKNKEWMMKNREARRMYMKNYNKNYREIVKSKKVT